MRERYPDKRLGLFAYDRIRGKEKQNLYWRGEKALPFPFMLGLVLPFKLCYL